MPVIKVWCLPKTSEKKLRSLFQDIMRSIVNAPVLGLKTEDVTCLFPSDMMRLGLGEEIIIEVTGLFDKPERTEEVRRRLAERIGKAVRAQFPNTGLVECFIYPFSLTQGFWSSRQFPLPFRE